MFFVILISSVLSAFAGVLVATIMVPPESSQNSTPQNEINAAEEDVNNYEGFMDALTSGTNQGLIIFLNVLKMSYGNFIFLSSKIHFTVIICVN